MMMKNIASKSHLALRNRIERRIFCKIVRNFKSTLKQDTQDAVFNPIPTGQKGGISPYMSVTLPSLVRIGLNNGRKFVSRTEKNFVLSNRNWFGLV